MQLTEVWNSLEVAKLLVSALTPIVVAALGYWIGRTTRRIEQMQWTNQKIIERRINIYDEIAPMLNDLLVYFTFVGRWKELSPRQIIESKRILDRRVHVSASLFSDQVHSAYSSFIDLCFSTYQGWGRDVCIRMNPRRHRDAAADAWKSEWDELFCKENDWTDPEKARSAYQALIKALAEDLQLGLQFR